MDAFDIDAALDELEATEQSRPKSRFFIPFWLGRDLLASHGREPMREQRAKRDHDSWSRIKKVIHIFITSKIASFLLRNVGHSVNTEQRK